MSENIIKKPFGLNVAIPQKTVQEIQKIAKQELEEITVNPFINYFEENDKVFSGKVADEIDKYRAQMYSVNQLMNKHQPRSTFNINI